METALSQGKVESNRRRMLSPQDNELDSAGRVGEPAREWRSLDPAVAGKPVALKGNVIKRRQGASGGWRRNERKDMRVKQGDLHG